MKQFYLSDFTIVLEEWKMFTVLKWGNLQNLTISKKTCQIVNSKIDDECCEQLSKSETP